MKNVVIINKAMEGKNLDTLETIASKPPTVSWKKGGNQ